ncbi:MAG: alpha/beta fold hydrolase [Acidobacteriota bacterium]
MDYSKLRTLTVVVSLSLLPVAALAREAVDPRVSATVAKERLLALHGEEERQRIERGVHQITARWTPADGDLEAFAVAEFLPRGDELDLTFQRFEFARERIGGYMTSLIRDLRRGADLEIGPMLPLDRRLAALSPDSHIEEDLYAGKIAFVALLNFPQTTLAERLAEGLEWDRRQWAETRLAGSFGPRVPAEVQQGIAAAMAAADSYINGYNIHMHHLLTEEGERLFPEGLRLISHWGLRDELKARYADPEGLPKQRMIQRVFERIVRQEVPAVVIDNPSFDWAPGSNAVEPAPGAPVAAEPALRAREEDERYRHWLAVFRAQRAADPYSPALPTYIDRRFEDNREIPEREVEALFDAVLSSPHGVAAAKLVAERLGRPLEPFDIWYAGFKPGGGRDEAELDALTRRRYPTADAFAADMPRILEELGFTPERSEFLAARIAVEPSRGAGHAFGPARRDDKAHLRTRVGEKGMDYKGYNIAVHELGHNVEQVFSTVEIDHTLIQGVPNTAFTEALAFVFQDRDLEVLGLSQDDPDRRHWAALDTFWGTREIAGVALTDMKVWRWLYDHPEATPAEMRQAVAEIAGEVWNRYFADLFGVRDVPLLAVYSHMVDGAMYTPDYPLGHLISFQIEEHFRSLAGPFGEEFERISRLGRLTPDAWMRQAVGSPLSAEPLLAATGGALVAVGRGEGARTASKTVPSADGVPIHYRVTPALRKTNELPLLLIHCWCCDAGYWQPVTDRLAADRKVVAIDLAGHGESGAAREDFTMESFAADVAAVVAAEGLGEVIFVGHSMGAFVMVAAAERLGAERVAGLISVDAIQNVAQEFDPKAVEDYASNLERDFAGHVERMVRAYSPEGSHPAVVDRIVEDLGEGPPAVGISAYRELTSYDLAGTLGPLDLPLRLVDSKLTPIAWESNREHTASFGAVQIDSVGHWLMWEKPDELAAALLGFAAELVAD